MTFAADQIRHIFVYGFVFRLDFTSLTYHPVKWQVCSECVKSLGTECAKASLEMRCLYCPRSARPRLCLFTSDTNAHQTEWYFDPWWDRERETVNKLVSWYDPVPTSDENLRPEAFLKPGKILKLMLILFEWIWKDLSYSKQTLKHLRWR